MNVSTLAYIRSINQLTLQSTIAKIVKPTTKTTSTSSAKH